MLRIPNDLNKTDPLPGLGPKVVKPAPEYKDPIKAFNKGWHPASADVVAHSIAGSRSAQGKIPLPPPFSKNEKAATVNVVSKTAVDRKLEERREAKMAVWRGTARDGAVGPLQARRNRVIRLCDKFSELGGLKLGLGKERSELRDRWLNDLTSDELILLAENYKAGTRRLDVYYLAGTVRG
jgi:hypothetical protein